MSETNYYIAVDLGAESGRAILGALSGDTLTIEEVHRFQNGAVKVGNTLRWDFDRLLAEVKTGIRKCVQAAPGEIAGIAVDSWGLDFGLLDENGDLVEPPCHYRDARTNGMLEEAFKRMPRETIYERTGIQFMQINTLYQLLAMRLARDPALEKARALTFIADLVAHSLCGKLFAEYTLASTSQIMDMRTGEWSQPLLEALDLPANILPPVIPPATVVGELEPDIAAQIGCAPMPVIAAASHDTACAVAAVPARTKNWAYLSSGTWSLIGVEIPRPIINDLTCENSFTNEGGVEGTIRLLKNITGLWILQECRRHWLSEGHDLSYARLTDLAARARPFAARIDPGHPDFLAPGDMPARINAHLEQTGQRPITDRGEIVRTILEGLAFAYRDALDILENITGAEIEILHIVGGGARNRLLNQFAADATNRTVAAGPVEATSIGNILLQAKALGHVRTLDHLRAIVAASFPVEKYAPKNPGPWDKEYHARAGAI